MVTWNDGAVSTRPEVGIASPLTGGQLRDAYVETLPAVTFGLVKVRNNAVTLGPIQILSFGPPRVTTDAVEWPIEGGLLARRAGGRWRIQAADGRVVATASGYNPRLPRPIYVLTHLQVHQLFTRLYLLRLRGREPAPGPPAGPRDRRRAAMIDVAFCFTLAGFIGRPRRRLRRTLVIAAAYHVACWSISGRTLGGLVMRQRVVAVDGSRLTPAQAIFRLALLPASWITRRPLHDELASTEVVTE